MATKRTSTPTKKKDNNNNNNKNSNNNKKNVIELDQDESIYRNPDYKLEEFDEKLMKRSSDWQEILLESSPIECLYYVPTLLEENEDNEIKKQKAHDKRFKEVCANVDCVCEARAQIHEIQYQWSINNLDPYIHEVGDIIESHTFPDDSASLVDKQQQQHRRRHRQKVNHTSNEAFTFKILPHPPQNECKEQTPTKLGLLLQKEEQIQKQRFDLIMCFDMNAKTNISSDFVDQNGMLKFRLAFKVHDDLKEIVHDEAFKKFEVNLRSESQIVIKSFSCEKSKQIFSQFYINSNYLDQVEMALRLGVKSDLHFVFDLAIVSAEQQQQQQQCIPTGQNTSLNYYTQAYQYIPTAKNNKNINRDVLQCKSNRLMWTIEKYALQLRSLFASSSSNKISMRDNKSLESLPYKFETLFGSLSKPPLNNSDISDTSINYNNINNINNNNNNEKNETKFKWSLQLFPHGVATKFKEDMSLFLRYISGPENDVVVHIEYGLLDINGNSIHKIQLPPEKFFVERRVGIGSFFNVSNLINTLNNSLLNETPQLEPSNTTDISFIIMCKLTIFHKQYVFRSGTELLPTDNRSFTSSPSTLLTSVNRSLYKFYRASKHVDCLFVIKLNKSEQQSFGVGGLKRMRREEDIPNNNKQLAGTIYVTFAVHKLVLLANSLYLQEHFDYEEMYKTHPNEVTNVQSDLKASLRGLPVLFTAEKCSLLAFIKFVRFLYRHKLDVEVGETYDDYVNVTDIVNEPMCIKMIFDILRLAMRYDVKALFVPLEQELTKRLKIDNMTCLLDNLAEFIFDMKELMKTTTSPRRPELSTHNQSAYRLFKEFILRYFLRNLNVIVRTRPRFLIEEFALTPQRQCIYDELKLMNSKQ